MQSTLLAATLGVLVHLAICHRSPDGYETFPSSGHPHPSSAYKLHQEYRTWEQAGPVCSSEGGHLIVINSQEEAEIARTLISRTSVAPKKPKVLDQFHIGMHCKGHIGHWVTVLGGSLDDAGWTNWAPNQPSPDSPRPVHCGALLRSHQFNNLACAFHLSRFICEKTVAQPVAPAPAATTPGPQPQPTRPAPQPSRPRPQPVPQPSPVYVYETFPSAHEPATSSYKLHRERVPWDIAYVICKREGAHLAIVNSDEEATILATIFGRVPPFSPPSHRGYDVLHVGISDKDIEGHWLTVEGDAVATCGFNKWRRGEPDNRGGLENCGGFTRDKRLVDLDCITADDSFPFVCEKYLNHLPYGREDIDVRGHKRH